jgi:hypothetical protein
VKNTNTRIFLALALALALGGCAPRAGVCSQWEGFDSSDAVQRRALSHQSPTTIEAFIFCQKKGEIK